MRLFHFKLKKKQKTSIIFSFEEVAVFYGPSLWRHNSLLCNVGVNKGTESVSRLSPELLAETVSIF